MISLPNYRQNGDTDDIALQKALDAAVPLGEPVYLPANGGLGPDGAYLLGTSPGDFTAPAAGNLRSGAVLYGDGIGRTVILRRSGAQYIFLANSLSENTADNRAGIQIKSMTLRGNNPGLFDERSLLVVLAGVTNTLFEQVEFRDFNGDGLYLGSPYPDQPRHNLGFTVRTCSFVGSRDSVGVCQSRNGISVVDCLDWLIDGTSFTYCTRSDQPGPIDVEPEKPHQRVERGKVTGCYFENNGGFALNLAFGIDQQALASVSDIRFEYSSVRQSTGAFAWTGFHTATTGQNIDSLTAPAPYNINVSHLYVINTAVPFRMRGAYGLTFTANEMYDCDSSSILANGTSRSVAITGNAFVRCGNVNGAVVIDDGSVLNYSISGNHFIDCGRPDGNFGPIYYLRGGDPAQKIDGLKLNDNRVEVQSSPARTTQIALRSGDFQGTVINSEKLRNTAVGFTPADNLL